MGHYLPKGVAYVADDEAIDAADAIRTPPVALPATPSQSSQRIRH